MHRDWTYLVQGPCLVPRLETQNDFSFHFLKQRRERLRDFFQTSRRFAFYHCREVALKFPSSHRDRSKNKTVVKEHNTAVG